MNDIAHALVDQMQSLNYSLPVFMTLSCNSNAKHHATSANWTSSISLGDNFTRFFSFSKNRGRYIIRVKYIFAVNLSPSLFLRTLLFYITLVFENRKASATYKLETKKFLLLSVNSFHE